MDKVVVNSYEDFEKLLGRQIGISDYVEVSQDRINLFADATLDHQWIHVDTERAKVESPYHSTIVHGYLTLSLLPHMWNQIIEVNNLKMMINYGMDKMKFGQAVLAGQSIRMVASLHSLQNLRGVAKAEIKFTIVVDFHGAAAGSLGIVVTVQYVVVHKGTDHGHGGHDQHYEAYERDRFPLFPRFDIFIIDHYICPSIPAFL